MDIAPEDLPPLPPECKINMTLDEIIKYDKIRGAISYNLYKRPYRRGRPFKPYMWRRYRSQNWRLRGNAPNTPRYWRKQAPGRIRSFLQRKWSSTPLTSVFHRLGWNPSQEAARNKLHFARNYQRPSKFAYYKTYTPSNKDPNRIQKLMASARLYRQCNGLNIPASEVTCDEPILNQVNISKLTEALGPITSVKEEGSVVTIQRLSNSSFHNHFTASNSSMQQYNPYFSNQSSYPVFSNVLNPMTMDRPHMYVQQPNNFGRITYQERNLGTDIKEVDYTSPLLRKGAVSSLQRDQLACETPPPLTAGNVVGFCKVNGPGVNELLPLTHRTTMNTSSRFGGLNPFIQGQDIC